MKNKNDMINKLKKEISKLQYNVDNTKKYNTKAFMMRRLLNGGKFVNGLAPYLLTSAIIFSQSALEKNPPFHIDQVPQEVRIETIDSTNGYHQINKYYDSEYDYNYNFATKFAEHSTAWTLNENNMYERTSTKYIVNQELYSKSVEALLAIPIDELVDNLLIEYVQVIQKKDLDKQDAIYNEEVVVITDHIISDDEYYMRYETENENILYSMAFIVFSLLCGFGAKQLRSLVTRDQIKNTLEGYLSKYKNIEKEDIENIKKIIALKKENLALLEGEEELVYTRRLRK